MNDQQQRDPGRHWRQQARVAYKKLKHNRAYALTDDAELALAAICKAHHDARGLSRVIEGDLDEFVARLANVIPDLRQQRAGDEETLPEWPVDPVTNERLPNPFVGGSLGDRNAVHDFSPKLAEYLQRLAKEGPWKLHNERLKKAAEKAEIASIHYGAAEHEANPFLGDDRTAQTLFVQNNSEEKITFYEREAKAIRFPWQNPINRFELGKLLEADKELGEFAMKATDVQNAWALEQKLAAEAEAEEARHKLQDAEAKLGKVPLAPNESRLEQVRDSAGRGGLPEGMKSGRPYLKAWKQ